MSSTSSSTLFPFLSSSSTHTSPRVTHLQASPSHLTFRQPLPSISAAYTTTADERTPVHSTKTQSFYELLGVQHGATYKEVKAAYRKLARVLHPDAAVASSDGGERATSVEEFMRIREAYDTLSNPVKRADYDTTLLLNDRIKGETTSWRSGLPGYWRPSWETDQCW